MNCIACQYFSDKCTKVKIYASGHCKECPGYGSEEPILSPSGCNLQIMRERISSEHGFEAVVITPMTDKKNHWYCQIMICFDGKGRITTTQSEQCLPGVAIWTAWREALGLILPMDHPGLNKLVMSIERRLGFEYSLVEYIPVVLRPQEDSLEPMKRKLFIPKTMDHLLDVQIEVNKEKDSGDQLDLFAV